MSEMVLLNLLFGFLLLFFGRRLFWIFVGIAGFLVGLDFATRFFSGSDTTRFLIALACGIIGAVLAVIFYKVAVAIAGFVIGGYLGVHLAGYLAIHIPQSMTWVPYVIGGIIGAILILLLFDWALIVLSSFAGASLIVHAVTIRQINMGILFIVLAVIGILVQAGILLHSRSSAA